MLQLLKGWMILTYGLGQSYVSLMPTGVFSHQNITCYELNLIFKLVGKFLIFGFECFIHTFFEHFTFFNFDGETLWLDLAKHFSFFEHRRVSHFWEILILSVGLNITDSYQDRSIV